MQYFDFNIPYTESPPSSKAAGADKSARKQTRLKLAVKAMELGYAGVAYNHTIKGVMSESDRCSISPFPLSSLLAISPSLSSSASFHRRLLGTRVESPFRQYTRLTVTVEDHSQATGLNSGNAVLKTYDLVAARPMNQKAFDQICQYSEVDLIAIDYSDKLPFRLNLPMVKAAIARGVYFEITYSGLLDDVKVRRQLISNAKLLVDWTRGKNLIVSSAAPSVLDFRGPNDVANLLSLLGLTTEHAKAAISKNCRSLISNAIRKKQFHKEVIRVELMPSGTQSDPTKSWNDIDSLVWDPIASEGDLVLDDLAKSFSKAGKLVSKQTVKAIDAGSIVKSKDHHNYLPTKQLRPGTEDESHPSDAVLNTAVSSSTRSEMAFSEMETASLSHVRQPVSLFGVDHRAASDNSKISFSSEPFRPCASSSKASICGATSSACEVTHYSADPSMEEEDVAVNGEQVYGLDVKKDFHSLLEKDLNDHLGIEKPSTSVKVVMPVEQIDNGENHGKTRRHRSRTCDKSGKDKFKQRGLRFPFKNVFQIPFKKRKPATSKLKIKK